MGRKRKNINKKQFKHIQKKCIICGEPDYKVLDVHRIKPGKDGGAYTTDNTISCCANCHRKIHDQQIEIDRYYHSTSGRLLRVIIDGKELFLK